MASLTCQHGAPRPSTIRWWNLAVLVHPHSGPHEWVSVCRVPSVTHTCRGQTLPTQSRFSSLLPVLGLMGYEETKGQRI